MRTLFARVKPPNEGGGLYHPQSRRHIDLVRFIKENGNVPQHARILDVGCGKGSLATRLAAEGFRNLNGADWIPAAQIESMAPGLFREYRQVDLNERALLDYESASFDCIVCSDVLEHLERPALLLRELARVTRAGGSIYVTLPNAFNVVERLLLALTGNSKRYRIESPKEFGHISMFPSNVLQSLLNRAKLRIESEGRGFAAVAGVMVLPDFNFGSWASYCSYYCLIHSAD